MVSPLEGVENEHFIVWMRTAALPTFRKLYGKIDKDLDSGSTVTFEVDASFSVTEFEGKKSLVLSVTDALAGSGRTQMWMRGSWPTTDGETLTRPRLRTSPACCSTRK